MTTAMALDLLLAALLVATIAYAILLNRRLTILRQGKEELRRLIADFMEASEKARTGMTEMRTSGETTAHALTKMLDEAQGLRDDLNFLIERGGAMADRLERDVRGARPHPSFAAAPAPPAYAEAVDAAASGSSAAKLRRILEATR